MIFNLKKSALEIKHLENEIESLKTTIEVHDNIIQQKDFLIEEKGRRVYARSLLQRRFAWRSRRRSST